MPVTIELIAVPGCARCAGARAELRAAAESLQGEHNLRWREIDVLEELDYAVSLGVLSMPAVAVNGRLAFSALPTPEQLCTMLSKLEASGGPRNAA